MQQHLLLLFKSKYAEICRVQKPVGDCLRTSVGSSASCEIDSKGFIKNII